MHAIFAHLGKRRARHDLRELPRRPLASFGASGLALYVRRTKSDCVETRGFRRISKSKTPDSQHSRSFGAIDLASFGATDLARSARRIGSFGAPPSFPRSASSHTAQTAI